MVIAAISFIVQLVGGAIALNIKYSATDAEELAGESDLSTTYSY